MGAASVTLFAERKPLQFIAELDQGLEQRKVPSAALEVKARIISQALAGFEQFCWLRGKSCAVCWHLQCRFSEVRYACAATQNTFCQLRLELPSPVALCAQRAGLARAARFQAAAASSCTAQTATCKNGVPLLRMPCAWNA